jgi:beta-galactosidase
MRCSNFNDSWYYYRDGDETDARPATLPHDAQLGEPRSPDNPMDSGYFPGGKYVYIKKFSYPSGHSDEAAYIEFDGVYMNAEVFVNGRNVCFQPYGYTNFIIPVQDYLAPEGLNEIRVVADNSQFPNARWYTGAGIYRNVCLHTGPARHIKPYGIKIRTVSIDPARISISISIEPPEAAGSRLVTDILYGEEVIASSEGFAAEIEIPGAKLWNAEHPELYTARCRLLCEGGIMDEAAEVFGIRAVTWDISGMRVNGEQVLLRGGCVHHDNGLLGAAAWPVAEDRKVRILKEAGFNAIRSSHNPCSRAMLEACDRHGMYLMDEFADMWTQHKHKYDYAAQFPEWYERDLTAMVRKDYNHPSVIMYSIGNEVGESATAEGVDYAKKMTELLHRLDPSRPVTCGVNPMLNGLVAMGKGLYQGDGGITMNKGKKGRGKEKEKEKEKEQASGSTFVNTVMSRMGGAMNYIGRLKRFDLATRDVLAVLDVAGYNYGAGRYKIDPKQYPERITVGTETLPPSLYRNWSAVRKYPNLIGDFMWTSWDYLGEAGLGVTGYGSDTGMPKPYPTLLAGPGVIEITGECRPEVFWNQIIWGLRREPYIAVEPLIHAGEKAVFGMWRSSDARHSWSWRGCEGKETFVTVYAEGGHVELFLNGKLIGRRKVKAHKAKFRNVRYMPGELKAVAYGQAGGMIGEDVLVSASPSLALHINPEKTECSKNELLYAGLSIADGRGIRELGAAAVLHVSVAGGKLIALGSADPAATDSYQGGSCSTYYGFAQAIIMPGKDSTQIDISVTADGFDEASVSVDIR